MRSGDDSVFMVRSIAFAFRNHLLPDVHHREHGCSSFELTTTAGRAAVVSSLPLSGGGTNGCDGTRTQVAQSGHASTNAPEHAAVER